jgi:putative Mg2+ transporter-C (MgtC) family protein
MINTVIGSTEINFLINIGLCIAIGLMIGFERETRNKDAGIGTSILIITGAMLFAFISQIAGGDTSRIAAQIVSGIGFIGAGLIIRDGSNVKNITTAAGIWLGAAIGMAIGFQLYTIAIISGLVATFVPRIPHYRKREIEPSTD